MGRPSWGLWGGHDRLIFEPDRKSNFIDTSHQFIHGSIQRYLGILDTCSSGPPVAIQQIPHSQRFNIREPLIQ